MKSFLSEAILIHDEISFNSPACAVHAAVSERGFFGKLKYGYKFYALLSLILLVMCSGTLFAAEKESSEPMLITADLLLPKSTCAYASIRNITELRETWAKTSLGEMQETEKMQEFFKALRGQLGESASTMQKRLGITIEDLWEVASTEVSGALLQLDPEHYGMAIIVNVGDKQYETQSTLTKIAARVTEAGGTHQKQQVADAEIHIFNILDPETKKANKAYHILKKDLLICSDRAEVVKDVLTRLNVLQSNSNAPLESFSEVDAYLDILNKTIVDDHLPDIILYCDPIRYLRVNRLIQIEKDPEFAKEKDLADTLCAIGFDGIEAVGGVITFRHKGFDATQRFLVSIPKEKQKALKMLSFDTKPGKEIPDWISAKAGAVHVINLDFLTAFDNLGPLVNQLFGEGSDTVWDDVLDGFENDPYGPQINLRNEVVSLFENKLIFMVQNNDPQAIDAERCLVAIPVKDAAKIREKLAALLDEEPTFEKIENGEDVRWKLIDEKQGKDVAGASASTKRFPEMTLTVWENHLLIASEPGFIDWVKVYDPAKADPITETPNFKLMKAELDASAGNLNTVSFHYVNSEVHREHTYEMVKSGTMAESAATFSSALSDFVRRSATLKNGKTVDASDLPEFDSVKKYFLPTGGYMFETEGGIIYQGLWLSQEKMNGSTVKVAPRKKASKTTKKK